MKAAGIYIRVSTERQSEKVSPQAQEDDCREYCTKKGYQVVEVYRDIERYKVGSKLVEPSGTRADRPGLKRMLADARTGKIQVIVAWREDRLYRSYRPMLDVLDCLDDSDIDIELAKESFDKRLAPVKAWAAKMELDAKHDRFLMGVGGKLEKGKAVFFTPPYGYTKNNDNIFQVDRIEGDWILKIWQWYADGLSMKELRQRLIIGGAQQRRDGNNRLWLPAFIYKLLRCDFYYTGIFPIKWGGESFEIPIPVIVPADVAERVKQRREQYQNYPAGNLKEPNLAGGLCYCKEHNSMLQVCTNHVKSNGKTYYYTRYRCRVEARRYETSPNCCNQISIETIDNQIWEKVWGFVSDSAQFETALQSRIEALQAQEIDAGDKIERLSKQLDDLMLERQRVITFGRKGIITEDDLETQLLALSFQENGLKRELSEAQLLTGGHAERLMALAENYRAKVAAGIEAINAMPDSPEAAQEQFNFRREIIRTIVSRVDVLADKTIKVHLDIDFNISISPTYGTYTDTQNLFSFMVTI